MYLRDFEEYYSAPSVPKLIVEYRWAGDRCLDRDQKPSHLIVVNLGRLKGMKGMATVVSASLFYPSSFSLLLPWVPYASREAKKGGALPSSR
jgi:hypothetical protein